MERPVLAPFLPAYSQGPSFAKNMKETHSNIPLTSVKWDCKNIPGGVDQAWGRGSNPTFITNWLGALGEVM